MTETAINNIQSVLIEVAMLIEKIELRQPVLNRAEISELDLAKQVNSVANLGNAKSGQLSFLAKASYLEMLKDSQASVIIVTEKHKQQVLEEMPEAVVLVVPSPYLGYASCSQLFEYRLTPNATSNNIHPSAVISDKAHIAESVVIGANVFIDDDVVIADGCHISANVSVGRGTVIAHNCVIFSNVSIAHDVQIGHHTRIHANASIGFEGFGFAPTTNPSQSLKPSLSRWERIAQLGTVIVGNHVRIGSNTCIDRGAVDNTIIADNVIIDNLVQIAHNVKIGDGTAIAAKTGIAGSTTIGKNCIIGGAVGMTGHFEIADNVTITAMSLVTKSISKPGSSYSSGMPAIDSKTWRRMVARLRMLVK